jgi:4-amino-4-deoxy-L-arabinose transferase-like glycosyltransferase
MDHIQVPLHKLNPYLLLGIFLLGLALFSLYVFKPIPTNVYGNFADGSYWQAMDAVSGGHVESYFLPNRITTGLGLILAAIAGGYVFHSREFTWMLLSVLSYVGTGLFFYALALRLLKNARAAFLSTLIVALNYGAIVWGLNYTADQMGWFFFMAALYSCWRFLEGGGKKWLWLGVLSVALGGVFKEYAPCAYIGIACSIALYKQEGWGLVKKFFLMGLTGALCLVPLIAANAYSWFAFHYTYLDWWHFNHTNQVAFPDSYLEEYIKILGGIYNFAWLLFIPGLFLFWKRRKELSNNLSLQFIIVMALSSLPVFIWPPFQRIFFITVPAFALVCGLYFAHAGKRALFIIVPLLMTYVLTGYFMDAYVLPNVNIGPILHLLLLLRGA